MEENKPRKWLVVILIILAVIIITILLNKIITDKKEKYEDKKEKWSIFNLLQDLDFVSTISAKSFNSKYERYAGSKSGFFLEDLLENVVTNNKTNKNHKIKLIYGELSTEDPEDIKNIKQKIESGDEFEVSLNYNNNGYVHEVVLKQTKKDMSKVNMFNSDFSFFYNGTEYGTSVKDLLDKVITNNQTNNEHIVTLIYKDINTSDVDQIRNIKKELDKWTEYEIIYDYNEEGYIYQIRIEE